SQSERTRGRAFATALSMRVLSRNWQMLLKGIAEVQAAGRPISAAEMVLVRIAYAADLPTPDEALRALDNSSSATLSPGNGNGRPAPVAAPTASAATSVPQRYEPPRSAAQHGSAPTAGRTPLARSPATNAPEPASTPLVINTFEELVALAAEKRDIQAKISLQRDVRLVHCENGRLEIALEPGAAKTLVNDLSRKFQQWTGRPWMVVVSSEQGAPTLKSQAEAREATLKHGVRSNPLVKAVLDRFPGAEIIGVR